MPSRNRSPLVCAGKISHPNAKEATQEMAAVIARAGRKVGRPNVFYCEVCKGFHWGHTFRSR